MSNGTHPKVSVLMCVFDGEKYLHESIESILGQTYRDFEFIIIDDASSDESVSIMKSYDDPRIRVFCNRENIGLTKSLNKGIGLARGEYIARQDADDFSLPHRFARQVEYLQLHQEVVALGARLCFIDEDGWPIGEEPRVTRHEDIVAMLMRGSGALPHPAVMMRADSVRAVNGYREQFKAAQDVDLWLRLAEHGQLANLEDVLLKYRLHERQIGSAKRGLQREAARQAIIDAYDRQGKPRPAKVKVEGAEAMPSWELHRNWSQMALRGGNRLTGTKHAMISIRQAPWSTTTWLMLFKAMCPRVRMRNRLRNVRKYVLTIFS